MRTLKNQREPEQEHKASHMKVPSALWGLTAQLPFLSPTPDKSSMAAIPSKIEFAFKEGVDVFSPKDLVTFVTPFISSKLKAICR